MNIGNIPVIRGTGDFSGCCKTKAGVKVLHRIHRTLPPFILQNEDVDVLQDESAAAILDETTNSYIYDTMRVNASQFES
jgi:hypothetical protein